MFQGEHSAILSTFIKLPFVIKIFVLTIFESVPFTQVLLYYLECIAAKLATRKISIFHLVSVAEQNGLSLTSS